VEDNIRVLNCEGEPICTVLDILITVKERREFCCQNMKEEAIHGLLMLLYFDGHGSLL